MTLDVPRGRQRRTRAGRPPGDVPGVPPPVTRRDLPALFEELNIPAYLAREQEWQTALRLVLPRLLPVKLIRQQTGNHKVEHGGYVQGAPVGAADLSGWVVGSGVRIELEAKYADGEKTMLKSRREAQRRWLAVCAEDGCVALVLTYDPAFDAHSNLESARDTLRAALLARGVAA